MRLLIMFVVACSLLWIPGTQIVSGSPLQPDNRTVGYEILGDTLHFWNTQDDYYINMTSGIQLTNHYQEYWTYNIFCGGRKPGEAWIDFCTDTLPFQWEISTDNTTYFNYSGTYEVSFQGKSLEINLTYHLKTDDLNLTVEPSFKNTGGRDITDLLRFRWEIRDIHIGTVYEDNQLHLGTHWLRLNDSHDVTYDNLTIGRAEFIYDGDNDTALGQWLGVYWNVSDSHDVEVKSEPGEYNAPTAINFYYPGVDSGEMNSTTVQWIDVGCRGTFWIHERGKYYSVIYNEDVGLIPDPVYMSDKNATPRILYRVYDYTACPAPPNPALNNCNGVVCLLQWKWENETAGQFKNLDQTDGNKVCTDDINFTDDPFDAYDSVGNYSNTLFHDTTIDLRVRVRYDEEQFSLCTSSFKNNYRVDNFTTNHNTPTSNDTHLNVSSPSQNMSFECSYTFFDADADGENNSYPGPYVQWRINGTYNSSFDNVRVITPDNTSYGDLWACRVKVIDTVYETRNEEWSNWSDGENVGPQTWEATVPVLALSGIGLIFVMFATKLRSRDEILQKLFLVMAMFTVYLIPTVLYEITSGVYPATVGQLFPGVMTMTGIAIVTVVLVILIGFVLKVFGGFHGKK